MLPIRDINPTRRTPFVTWGLIAIHVVLWIFAWSLGPDATDVLIRQLGVVPASLTAPASSLVVLTPITSILMHAGWLHLLGNVWFLHIFGDNVEDHLGHARYAVLYLLAGLCAVAAHVALAPDSQLPLVGASGAIAGVLGAYMIRFPRAPILAWFVIGLIELPAFAFLFVWLAYQLWMTIGYRGSVEHGGVAFAAHVGGFVAGIALDRLLGPTRAEMQREEIDRKRRLATERAKHPHRQWLKPD